MPVTQEPDPIISGEIAAPRIPGIKPGARMIQLDVLRGVAILLVLGRHFTADLNEPMLLHPLAMAWYTFGWTGVDLFFVLSGFLVGGLLLGELKKYGKLDVKRFIIRRGFKIWPAYYALILGSIALESREIGWPASFKLYFFNLVHLQNYFGTVLLAHTWSLAVEEHFYLALPLLLVVLIRLSPHRRGLRALPWIAVAIMVLCTAARIAFIRQGPFDVWKHLFPTHLRIDGLAFGVLLAYLYHFHHDFFARIARHRRILLAGGLALVCPMIWNSLEDQTWWVCTIGYTMLYIGYGLILTAFVETPVGRSGGMLGRFFANPVARFTAYVGAYSYSIYIWHLSLARHQAAVLGASPRLAHMNHLAHFFLLTFFYLAMAIGIGVILGNLIEFPALAVRDRLFPSRTGALQGYAKPAASVGAG